MGVSNALVGMVDTRLKVGVGLLTAGWSITSGLFFSELHLAWMNMSINWTPEWAATPIKCYCHTFCNTCGYANKQSTESSRLLLQVHCTSTCMAQNNQSSLEQCPMIVHDTTVHLHVCNIHVQCDTFDDMTLCCLFVTHCQVWQTRGGEVSHRGTGMFYWIY